MCGELKNNYMLNSERVRNIFEKYSTGYRIHAVHAGPISPADERVLDEIELRRLTDFIILMDAMRIFAKTNQIPVVEVEELEDNYEAHQGDRVVVVGCFGDMCVAEHVGFLSNQGINAVMDSELSLVL